MEGSVFVAKCKWCEADRAVTKSGFCRDCDQMIREDILSKKARLEQLAQMVSPSISESEKQDICDEVKKIIKMLTSVSLNPVLTVGYILCYPGWVWMLKK